MELNILTKNKKREKPNKKCSSEEIKVIVDYLEEAERIELPIAQIFYKKLISKTGIDASWDIIRWKVRYFKASYKKVKYWHNSTEAGLLESDVGTSSVEAKILQMCPYCDQLSKIFGEKAEDQLPYIIFDTEEITVDKSLNTSTYEEDAK